MELNMNAEIICVGTELLLGDIINTNATYIAKGLSAIGINLFYQSVVGDNQARLVKMLEIAFDRSDIIILTGGLGPTYDDITSEAVAGFLKLPLEYNLEVLHSIEEYFKRLERTMTENNKKQALVSKGAFVFHNQWGTAPGVAITVENKIVIMLPGPPREMEPMFDNLIIPYLRQFSKKVIVSKTIKIFGMGESYVEDKLQELIRESLDPTIAPYAKMSEVELRVTSKADNEETALHKIQPIVDEIKNRLGDVVYSVNGDDLATTTFNLLLAKGWKIATAESCTGGLLSKRLTDISGSSKIFGYGLCTYANEAKMQLLGVKKDTLEKYSAVSEETAVEMAIGVLKLANSDISVSITGIADTNGVSEEKPTGTVYVATAFKSHNGEITTQCKHLIIGHKSNGNRDYVRFVSTQHALDMVRRIALAN